MTNLLIFFIVLIIVSILVYDRVKCGKAVYRGSAKANTLHAMEQANSPYYQKLVAEYYKGK